MEVVINGELKVIKSSLVSELLEELGISNKKLAIEINKNILPRDSYSTTILSCGDSLEIVHFIGGGWDEESSFWWFRYSWKSFFF